MSFLERLEPFLVSDDLIVHRFVMHNLIEYPDVPEHWTVQLLRQALSNKDQESLILVSLKLAPINRQALELLIQGVEAAELERKFLYVRQLNYADPEFILANRDLAERFYSEEVLETNRDFLESGAEGIWEQYHATITELEKEKYFNSQLYENAKEIARILAKKGCVEEGYIAEVLEVQKNKAFFSFEGILAVYLSGLMRLEQHVPFLAGLLESDDELLLEELLEVLSVFQSDAVVEYVNPGMEESGLAIFPIGVLKNTKTQSSIDKLIKLYSLTTNPEIKMYIVEALCFQLTEEAFPIVEDAIKKRYATTAFDADELYYGFFKVMEVEHPKLAEWKQDATERRDIQERRAREFQSKNLIETITEPAPKYTKIGRNEPCICGIGKKYKKCCGK